MFLAFSHSDTLQRKLVTDIFQNSYRLLGIISGVNDHVIALWVIDELNQALVGFPLDLLLNRHVEKNT